MTETTFGQAGSTAIVRRALTPNCYACAAKGPKIWRLQKFKGSIELLRAKLSRLDNSFTHLLGCQGKKFGNRRATLQHGEVTFAAPT